MDDAIYKTRVRKELVQRKLIQGTVVAGVGAVVMLLCGGWMPKHLMAYWGPLIVLLFLVLVTAGLLPYRRLQKLSEHPDELHISDDQLGYFKKGKRVMTIPISAVKRIGYLDSEKKYGIVIDLADKITLHDEKFRPTGLNGRNLFLPYFKRETVLDARLNQVVHLDEPN